MNATSSRAHTIVGIHFVQKQTNAAGKEMEKKALINLVDLAGRYNLIPIENFARVRPPAPRPQFRDSQFFSSANLTLLVVFRPIIDKPIKIDM